MGSKLRNEDVPSEEGGCDGVTSSTRSILVLRFLVSKLSVHTLAVAIADPGNGGSRVGTCIIEPNLLSSFSYMVSLCR